jgi:ATP-dependent Lon protease
MTARKFVQTNIFPLIPVRDIVVFPYMLVPLAIGRKKSLNAVKRVMEGSRKIVVAAQRDIYTEDPVHHELFGVGVIADIVQVLNLPDGSSKILIEGIARVKISNLMDNQDYTEAEVEYLRSAKPDIEPVRLNAMIRSVIDMFEEYLKLNPKVDINSYEVVQDLNDPDKLSDVVTGHIRMKKPQAQKLLEEFDPVKRMEKLSVILTKEINILRIKHEIDDKVHSQIEKSQKEYYLSEQMKAIKRELKGEETPLADEVKELEAMIKKSGMTAEAKSQAVKELDRLKKMMPFSPEATVVRTYLDWLIKLPWNNVTKDNIDLKKAKKILETEHHGLTEAKERILEYLAVSKLSKKLKAPILCFVGPPGTGKTSFGRSIAHALNRRFTRVSLGGIRDEAEIRGHRRTYIGALPGRIIQSVTKAGAKNPVFLLDEIDKMGKDFRGDPSSALLEALDPEQNANFSDHYLEIAFDLSNIMFITTANITSTIPPAMMDRMEIIEFPGYTLDEKINIAQDFLVPKQTAENGLKKEQVSFTDSALECVINNYTREAGVRNLEREIAKALRKVAKEIARGSKKKIEFTERSMRKYLGVPRYSLSRAYRNGVGVAAGLSWTPNGGESLSIEVSLMSGDGKLSLTGTLGDIMKESAQTAVSFIRANAEPLGVSPDFYKKKDIHIHVPAGAVPKEGPSAGITICAALVSRLRNKPVKKDVVMTGEITLSGRVLEIGGFKDKVLAAHRRRTWQRYRKK